MARFENLISMNDYLTRCYNQMTEADLDYLQLVFFSEYISEDDIRNGEKLFVTLPELVNHLQETIGNVTNDDIESLRNIYSFAKELEAEVYIVNDTKEINKRFLPTKTDEQIERYCRNMIKQPRGREAFAKVLAFIYRYLLTSGRIKKVIDADKIVEGLFG